MNTAHAIKKQQITKVNTKKNRIQRNRKIVAISILLLSLLIIGTSIKNMYVYYKSSNFIYAVDYYFTHWKDKNLRLIDVESMSVISKLDNTIEIEVYGFAYEKPYKKTYLIGTFTEDSKGHWSMTSVKNKNDISTTNGESIDASIETENIE